MRRAVVATLAVAVLAGAAVAAVPVFEGRAAAHLKAEIESDGTTKVDKVEVGLFARSVMLSNLRWKDTDEISADEWSLTGLSWPTGELLRGRTPIDGWRLGDPVQAARVEAKNVRLSRRSGASWTASSIVLEGLDLARFDGRPEPGPYGPVVVAARIGQALSLRRFEQRNLTARRPGPAAEVFSIASVVAENIDHGKIGAVRFSNFEVVGQGKSGPSFRMEELSADGIDFQRVLRPMSAAGWRFGMPIGRLGLESASASGFGGEDLARYGLSPGRITHRAVREGTDVLRSTTKIEGFVLAPPATPQALTVRLAMTGMGLNEVRLGFECTGVEDRGRAELTVERCTLAGPDLAELNFTVKLVQADQPFWEAIDTGETLRMLSSKVALVSAKLTLADKSLLERMLKAAALAKGKPVAAFRAEVASEVRRWQPAGVLISEDMTRMLDSAARFIEKGGTLAIEARPDPPFGVDKVRFLMRPDPDLVSLLGLSASLSR